MKMDEEDHKPRQALRKNNKKSEKALSQADFPQNPVISFSVLRATNRRISFEIWRFSCHYRIAASTLPQNRFPHQLHR